MRMDQALACMERFLQMDDFEGLETDEQAQAPTFTAPRRFIGWMLGSLVFHYGYGVGRVGNAIGKILEKGEAGLSETDNIYLRDLRKELQDYETLLESAKGLHARVDNTEDVNIQSDDQYHCPMIDVLNYVASVCRQNGDDEYADKAESLVEDAQTSLIDDTALSYPLSWPTAFTMFKRSRRVAAG